MLPRVLRGPALALGFALALVASAASAQDALPRPDPRFSGSAGMDVGRDNGLPVSPNWIYYLRRPFPFEGTIERVTFDLK